MANRTQDRNTPQDVTLGEVYRLVGDVGDAVSDLDDKVEDLNKKGLPKRVENLETWRDRALITLAGLAITGGALAGIGIA